jgi:hypothetical protein
MKAGTVNVGNSEAQANSRKRYTELRTGKTDSLSLSFFQHATDGVRFASLDLCSLKE